jgi:DNA-binding NtrC family response regulator
MNQSTRQPWLVDQPPADETMALAARYMRQRLDLAIEQHDDLAYSGAAPPELRELLRLRYGAALARVTKQEGERWAAAVARGAAASGRRIRSDVDAYVVEWDDAAATEWFRAEVAARWPAKDVGAAFLAADPVTLWTVCVALDLAPHRAANFADDRFPAPPLLITGPTGIGKELLAKAVHFASGAKGPFGAINCGGLPPQLLESELFGHVKGAFTGAVTAKKGLVEEYGQGTLFLDEVADTPPEVQVRLLRFLNDGEARKVGDTRSYHAFPRIIAATHVDLGAATEAGTFRQDLFHRLRGRHLHLRGLAERPLAALQPVIDAFLVTASADRAPLRLTTEVYVAMATYEWPGNMRELKYVVERLLNDGTNGRVVGIESLPDEIVATYFTKTKAPIRDVLSIVAARDRGDPHEGLQSRLKLSLGARFEEHKQRTDTRAASLRKAAGVVSRIGNTFGMEITVQPYIDVLNLAALEALAQEFQQETLTQLRTTAAEFQIDIHEAVAMYEALTTGLRDDARRGTAVLRSSLEESEKRYAAAAAIAAAVRVAQQSESNFMRGGIKFAESLLEFAGTPPFSETAKKWGKQFGSLSPGEARELWRVVSEHKEVVEVPTVAWKDVRDDLPALERLIDSSKSIRAAAEAMGVRPETVSRRVKAMRAARAAPKATRAQRRARSHRGRR